MATGYQGIDLNDPCKDDNLTYDWEECETLQIVRAFSISDYGTEYLLNQPSIEYPLVSERPTLSGIIDSEISNPPQRTISDVEEHYIEDDLSSMSDISHIKVSNAPRKHEYGKERAERKGNIYDKLYNACLKGKLSRVNGILEKHGTLMQDENEQTPLYAACIGNHTDIVKLLIDTGYDINHQDKEGKTPLHITFENHTPDFAQMLITEFKAKTEIRDKQNWTPLHTAIDRGYSCFSKELSENFLHQDIGTEAHRHIRWIQLHAACFHENTQDVQFLLAANTDVNHVSSAGHTSLHIAVTKGNIDVVTLLLDHDANVHSVAFDRKTPLHIATDKGDETIIQLLLTRKADPRMKDVCGYTTLHLAVRLKQEAKTRLIKTRVSHKRPSVAPYYACSVQTVQAIIDHGVDVNAVNNRGQTALWFACIDGQDSFVRILLDTGADPNIADQHEESCLHAAINGQCGTETIQKILDQGAHVNAANKEGTTPLLLACSIAQVETVKLLLKANADPNIAYADGDACLHAAIASDCSKETIQEIIDHGAEVNSVNKRGRTALLLGCFYRQTDSVKVLLEAGADPSIADEEGFSCLHAAIDGYCSKNTLQALIDHGAPVDATRKDGTNALLRACTTGQSDSVIFLLEAKADVNSAKPNGNTCLHEAINGKCNGESVHKIIQQGVNVNFLNSTRENVTALILACYEAQAVSVNLFLENGADPNISSADSSTSLHAAVYGHCTTETLQEIIAHKAHLNAQNIDGNTALWLACSKRQQDCVKILLEAGSSPSIARNDGSTSLHAAVNGNCSKHIILAILDHGADVNATNTKNQTALMLAAITKNKGAVNALLNAGADPNIGDDDGNTCLYNAVRKHCNKDVLQAIISHGADVNATNNSKDTALMEACWMGNEDAINVLLQAAADTNIASANGNTCLFDAVRKGCSKKVLEAIISHGADVNATNKANNTALRYACSEGNIDAINVLLHAAADTNIASADGYTCLHDAVRKGCSKKVLEAIISHGADVNATNKVNGTALRYACLEGNIDTFNVLLQAGADTNIAGANGNTCLHDAVRKGCIKDVLEAIISHGADVNATNKANDTALMYACDVRNVDAINVLLQAAADTNIVSADGNTCLFDAVRKGCSKDVLQAIISHGADVNATNKSNETALMKACWMGNEDAISVLLNAGADPNIAHADGYISLHGAIRKGCSKDVLEAIISHGADVNATNQANETALRYACWEGNIDTFNVLLQAGADTNIASADGNTLLYDAITADCSKDVLQAIISHGADLNATNKSNETALMRACRMGNEDAISVLLNAGADPNIAHADGYISLHGAIKKGCSKEVLEAIISHGADVNATNKANNTALMCACLDGNIDAIYVLLQAGADPNIAHANGNTCLHIAIGKGCCKDVLEAIISHSADVNATNKSNETALMFACWEGNIDALNVLLHGVPDPSTTVAIGNTCHVNAKNKNNETALILACEKGNKYAINVLLNAGADSNIADAYGETCLHCIARNDCCTEVLQAIISHGADVNATSKKNVTALMLACVDMNADAINELLKAGADPNIADDKGATCIHHAVFDGCSKDVLEIIVNHGGDVNVTNKNNRTTLILACKKGNNDAINVLFNAGADPNIIDANGATCIHYAVVEGCSKDVLEIIVNHGADVNATDKNHVTALMLACVKGNKDVINVLLNAGADPNIADGKGATCIYHAVGEGCSKDVLETIVNHGADVNAKNKFNRTALLIACVKGNKDAINILLNAGADPNVTDYMGAACIHHVVGEGCSNDVLETVVNHGTDIDAINKTNATALMLACEKGKKDAIDVLLNAGANPNFADADGDTCLHYIARNDCCTEVVQAVISHGADVNVMNENNVTALMIACGRGNMHVINVLLNAGANPRISDADDHTWLHEAVRGGYSQVVLETMINHGADVNATIKNNRTALMIVTVHGNRKAIYVLLSAGADPNSADADGDTCLHYAVRNGCCAEVLQAIISLGVDVNATNKRNVPALMLACDRGNKDAIKVLLNAGADPNLTDDKGATCIHCAVGEGCSKDVLEVVVNHGADVNATNKMNVTALMIACLKVNIDAINVLLNAGADPSIADSGWKYVASLYCTK